MSEADILQEVGGAPLPPKRPTIIRPTKDGRGSVPTRPVPARPAPPAPGGRPSSAVPKPPAASAAGPVPAAVTQRPCGPADFHASNHVSAKQTDPSANSSSKSKSQGSVRKRPEITIVDARPMSQAGFREIQPSVSEASAKPAPSSTNEDGTGPKPCSNGGLPAIPSRPSPASSATVHSTPPPSHSPPPIPSSRPDAPTLAPLPTPCPHPESPVVQPSLHETNTAGPPIKPARPTILRPGRPKSAIIPAEDPKTSPPPALPKRSPIVSETAAPADLTGLSPPPKPARSSHLNEGSQEEKKGEEEGDKGGGQAPKKPTRVSIIRPPRRPKSSVDAVPEKDGEPQEGLSQHSPRPRPSPPVSRPVAVVAAIPNDFSQEESPNPDEVEQTKATSPPVPAVRPRSSPRGPTPDKPAVHRSPVASSRNLPPNDLVGQGSHLHTEVDKPHAAPDRPKPPVPASRPHGAPSGGIPRLSHPVVPCKPLPTEAVLPVPSSHPSGTVPDSEGCLYAVSEPLEDSDIFTKLPESQPSRPPPPVPKSRPQLAQQASPMVGRPLPSVPGESSDDSASTEHSNWYEDVETARAQPQVPARVAPAELPVQQHSVSPTQPAEAADAQEIKTDKEIEAMYARVNKPCKKVDPQSSQPNSNPSENMASNPFGIRLKSVAAEGSPESEAPPVPPKLNSDETNVKQKPVLSPKPKPSIAAKPQVAVKPKSPRKEETPAETSPTSLEASTKSETSEQSKPPLVAKRPTIICSPKSQVSTDNTEDTTDVQMRERKKQGVFRPQSELSGSDSQKSSVTEPPVPSKRPMTIIGLPHRRQMCLEQDVGESKTSLPPVLRQENSDELENGRGEAAESVPGDLQMSHPPSKPLPAVTRPPPPRPGKPCKPEQPSPLPETKKPELQSTPARPPSPAPPRPASRPVKQASLSDGEGEETAAMSSSVKSTPPVVRKDSSPSEEESVKHRPSRPSGPPPRPMSMPPVKPPMPGVPPPVKAASSTTDDTSEKPSRPQPVRPTPLRESKISKPPPLPHRPGLSHPLYGYMAAQPHAIALHDYPANQADELPFQEGDTVVLVGRIDEQWLMGKVADTEGIFPQNFVHIIHPLHDELPSSAIDEIIDEAFDNALQEKPDLLQGPRCRARFDFESDGKGDLSFEDGDVIQLITHCGDDWLKGELNGKMGIFPAAFVEIIEDLPEEERRTGGAEGGEHEIVALFDFSGQAGELSFEAGDKIHIVSKVNDQWLYGQSGGREGSFPASFVDCVTHDLPMHSPHTDDHSPASTAHAEPPQPVTTTHAGTQDKRERWGTALFSFEKMQDGDLEFREGDRIQIIDQVGEEWVKGRLRGQEGVFPASFVRLDPGEASSDTVQMEDDDVGLDTHAALVTGKALFDFEGQADNELSFKAGDEIVLGSVVSEGSEWQWGELHGKKGMFPATFVEMV